MSLFRTIHEVELENGLTVLMAPSDRSPTVTSQVWYRVGSRCERTGITGISHVFEHMMFKGTERFAKGELDRVFHAEGMDYNAFTSHDFTAYYETMAADRLEVALEFESDRMRGLLLDPDEFSSEMAVIREERRQTREDPPFGLLSEAVEAATFMVHPYRWPVIGWMDDLEKLRLDDLREYYGRFYVPNNAVLVLAGAFAVDEAKTLVERHFGSIPKGVPTPAVCVDEPEQLGERTVTVHKNVQLPGLLLAHRVPGAGSPDLPALRILETVLLGGRSSRLYQRLVYRQPLVTGLTGGMHERTDPSTFLLRCQARPDISIESVRDEIYEELDLIVRDGITGDELERSFRSLEVDHVFGQESSTGLAQGLAAAECRTGWRSVETFLEDHRKVGVDEVQKVAEKMFDPKKRVVGYLVPESAEATS